MLSFTLVGDEASVEHLGPIIDACDYFLAKGMKCRLSHLSYIEQSVMHSPSSDGVVVYQSGWIENLRVADGNHTVSNSGLSKVQRKKIDSLTTSMLHYVDCDKVNLAVIIMKLMGQGMDEHVSFIICAYEDYATTSDGSVIEVFGESSEQITIAQKLGIKVVNICHPPDRAWLYEKLVLLQEV
jgi:hypothetical protein